MARIKNNKKLAHIKSNLLLIIIFSFSMLRCKKEQEITPTIFITPSELVLNYSMGEVVSFKVKAFSPSRFVKLTIYSKESSAFKKVLIDTLINSKENYSYTFEYKIPSKTSAYTMDLYFIFTDNNNEELSAATRLNIGLNNAILSEYSSNVFYSKASVKEDGYDLLNRVSHFSISTTPSVLDIKNNSTYDAGDSLARSWVSPAGALFVRFNSYNYNEATYSGIVNTYESGIKTDTISNLAEGDLIFTKINRNATDYYMLIKLNSIIDIVGSNNDTYIFNLKK